MEKKFILQDIVNSQYYYGSRFEVFFSKDHWMEFNSEEEAVERLQSEMNDFGNEPFEGRVFTIVTIYKFK